MGRDQRSFDQKEEIGKKIDWINQESYVLVNPHWPECDQESLNELAEKFSLPAHIWIASSGSSAKDLRSVKLIALSKSAFLTSAEAVNLHLKSNCEDIWLNPLPFFHVGGLSIYARAYLSRSHVENYQGIWNPENFYEQVLENRVTLASLVPTQIFDLVEKKIKSPRHLRALVIGGGALAPDVYEQALELGWPVLPSFGMTECCSQIATAELSFLKDKNPKMKILSHVQADLNSEGKLKIRSSALLTGFAQWQGNEAQWLDPKKDGWFVTEDQAILENGYIAPQGRGHQYIKILGEGVSLFRLQEIFEEIVRTEDPQNWQSYALISRPHSRKENEVIMLHATTSPDKLESIFKIYNSKVLSIEKAQEMIAVKEIPRTDLGKIKYQALAQDLKN